MEHEYREETEIRGGCTFPVLDKETGKRSKLCGASTPILDSEGQALAFCAEHRNVIEEFTKHKTREANARDRRNRFPDSKKFKTGHVEVHEKDRKLRIA